LNTMLALIFSFTNACDTRYDVPMLRDLVVLKPQWVIDHVVEIIRDQELHERKDKTAVSFLKKHRPHVKDLYDRAVLHGKLLEGFWPDVVGVDERGQLAALMERYGLLVRIHNNVDGQPVWIVPSLLEKCKTDVAVPPSSSSVFYIFFDIPEGNGVPKVVCEEDMGVGFLPAGFFHRLLGVATAYMQETVAVDNTSFCCPDLAKDCGRLYVCLIPIVRIRMFHYRWCRQAYCISCSTCK
jgi:hypothetical protein